MYEAVTKLTVCNAQLFGHLIYRNQVLLLHQQQGVRAAQGQAQAHEVLARDVSEIGEDCVHDERGQEGDAGDDHEGRVEGELGQTALHVVVRTHARLVAGDHSEIPAAIGGHELLQTELVRARSGQVQVQFGQVQTAVGQQLVLVLRVANGRQDPNKTFHSNLKVTGNV